VQGRDFGNTIEVLSGLEPNEVVVLNPPDSITNGVQVRIATPASGTAPASGAVPAPASSPAKDSGKT